MIGLIRTFTAFCLSCVLVFNAQSATARGISMLRDAEIEDTIATYAKPIFAAANLDPTAVKIHIINDPTLNAFVAGGQRLFLNSGLILATERPNQLIGVIAHETGHISGGHLARTHEALRNARVQTILAMLLGAAAAVASGKGEAAAAVIAGGAGAAQRIFLKYSRTQEAAADQAALTILDATGQSATGLLEFFEILGYQDALLTESQDPYLRSHPLTRDRRTIVRNHVAQSRHSAKPDPPAFIEAHKRVKAKLYGFLYRPKRTLRRYPLENTSMEARYARAAAYHKAARLDLALAEIDSLLSEQPRDPYFNELKGQILYEHGKVLESIPFYQNAVRIQPNAPLLRVGLAQSLISTDDPRLNAVAIQHLEAAVAREREFPTAWHQLSIAYGRAGRLGQSALASAEQNLAGGDYKRARDQAGRAIKKMPEGSPGWLRAQDIERAAKDGMKSGR